MAADPFNEALTHHRAGRLDQAARLYRQILAVQPDHADSLNLLGVINHQMGNREQAVELIRRAIEIRSTIPSYYVNLASVFRAMGRHEEAAGCARIALDIDPMLAEARLSLGISLQATKQYEPAEAQFRWLTDNYPGDSRGPQSLANCLRELGRMEQAVASYGEALARNPNDAAAHLGLGTLLLMNKNAPAAEPHLRRATEMLPGLHAAWLNFGSCLIQLGREREALPVCERATRLEPNDPKSAVNLGHAYLGSGEIQSAVNCFKTILNFHPEYPAALQGLADVYRETSQVEEAIPLYERVLQTEPSGDAGKGLAQMLWEFGDVDRAVALIRDRIARDPQDAENHVQLAGLLASGGDLAGAAASSRQALQLRAGFAPALVHLALTQRGNLSKEDRELLAAALEQPVSDVVRAALHFASAQVEDGLGNYAKAAEHLRTANALTKARYESRKQGYDVDENNQYVDRLIGVFDREFFAKTEGFGVADERPVFVVGMPRSGTTLVEQILARHPQVFGAGERRFAHQSLMRLAEAQGHAGEPLKSFDHLTGEVVQDCASWYSECLNSLDSGNAVRIVDKMPDNYQLLGWLAVLFPKARFIHCRRDARDVALSCWMTDFSMIRWANDLEQIAGRIRNYQRLMEHWRQVLPVKMFELDYERLVAEQEAESRRLVSWLGLEWNPACLEFYRSTRLVKTASVNQVRQPMYSRSVGRWRHYRDELGAVLSEFGSETEKSAESKKIS